MTTILTCAKDKHNHDHHGDIHPRDLSSPERYASWMNLTVADMQAKVDEQQRASREIHQRLKSSNLSGPEKHALLCEHRYTKGRHPFVCYKCWSYLPICLCPPKEETERVSSSSSSSLPDDIEVLIWVHHSEWGRTSNTGSILPLVLHQQSCRLLMKGLPKHDAYLKERIDNPDCCCVVLWPDSTTTHRTPQRESILVDELRQWQKDATHHQNEDGQQQRRQKIVLIAVDGTWRNARRMVAKLPLDRVSRLGLTMLSNNSSNRGRASSLSSGDSSSSDIDQSYPYTETKTAKQESLLAPLRKRGPSGQTDDDSDKDYVCTAEAIVAALDSLGLPKQQGQKILDLTKRKVDSVVKYRGKVIL